MFVCVCVCLPPRILITSDVIWTPYDWLNKFCSYYIATVVVASPTLGGSLSSLHTSCVPTVRTIKYDWQAIQVLWTFRISHLRTVSVQRSMKWGRRRLDKEENVTDLKERETNEERQKRLVNLCLCLHIWISNDTSYSWLARQRVNDRNRCAEQCEGPREGVSHLISVVAIAIIYAITHTDCTQYINTCNHGQACPNDACSICLVINGHGLGISIRCRN